MKRRVKIRSKSYNKKLFKRTTGARHNVGMGNAKSPFMRGTRRM